MSVLSSTRPSTPSAAHPGSAPCGASPAPVVRSRALHVVPEAGTLPTVVGAGLRVPTLHGDTAYANLDHAASTPALERVKAAVDRALETYSSVHRGAGFASRLTSAWYEQARAEVAAFVGAREGDSVIFTRTTTDSWALLSKALPSRTTVFVFGSEHHSTLLPWGGFRTVRLPVPQTVEDAHALLEDALTDHPSRHRLVVVAAASNVTGEVWPIERFATLAHEHGARIAVDAAQLSAHRRIDLAAWDADYVAFSGPKTYAPYAAGVLAGPPDGSPRTAPRGRPAPPATRGAAPTSSGRSRSPRRAPRSAATVRPSRSTRRACSSACSPVSRTSRGSRCCRSSATTPTVSAWSPSPSTAGTPPWCRRYSPSSTASGCATGSSAPTCSSTSCSRTRGASGPPRPSAPASGWAAPSRASSASWAPSPGSSSAAPTPPGP